MRLPTLPGLEVTLSVDRVDLEEHDDPDAEGEEAHNVRYVEAVSGANFAVELKRTDGRFMYRNYDLHFAVYLDGKFAEGRVFYADARYGGHPPRTVSGRYEMQNGQNMCRKFAFAALSTSTIKHTLTHLAFS